MVLFIIPEAVLLKDPWDFIDPDFSNVLFSYII